MVNPGPGPNDSGIWRPSTLELQESERRNRLLAENSPVGIWRSQIDGTMLYANPALIDILEYDSVEQLLQANVADFYKQPSQRAEWFR